MPAKKETKETKAKKPPAKKKSATEEKALKEYKDSVKKELEEKSRVTMEPVLPEPKAILLLPDADHLMKLATTFAKSALFPGVTTEFEAAAIIEYGRELNMMPITALQTIFPIPSKRGTRLCIKSEALLAMAQRRGVKVEILRRDAKGCKMKFSRKGQPDHIEEFTEEDAKRADLLGKDNWMKYPKAMYSWRCVSGGLKIFDPSVSLGLPTMEEIEDLEESPLVKEADIKVVSTEPLEPEKPTVAFTKSKDQPVETKEEKDEVIDAEVVDEKKEETEAPQEPAETTHETEERQTVEKQKEMVVQDLKEYLEGAGVDTQLFKLFLGEELQPKKADREFVGLKFGNWSFTEGKLEDIQLLLLNIAWAVDEFHESKTFKMEAQKKSPDEHKTEEKKEPF